MKIGLSLMTLVMFAGCLILIRPLKGQVTGAELRGTVADSSGAVIANSTVTARNVATGISRTTQSNATGLYTLPDLQAGAYTVTASVPGFSSIESNVVLTVGAQHLLNFDMKVGQVTEKVEATDTAAGVDLISSTTSGVTDAATTRGLPLNGRDWTQLATLEPGVAVVRTQQPIGQGGAPRGTRGLGEQLTLSGARSTQNTYRLDGIVQNDYANSTPGSVVGLALGAEAVQEFSVLTSGLNAEYGLTAGGVLNAVTRSGANRVHGSVYEFLRNDALDARNFFDVVKPPYRRNQFGGAVGGPILRNRTFFFFNYEGLRQSQGFTNRIFVPSAAARNGQLASGAVLVDPKVKPFLGLWPLPNGGLLGNGDTGVFIFPTSAASNENFETFKIDHTFSQRDSLYGTYLLDRGDNLSPDGLNVVKLVNNTRRQTGGIQETHVFNPRFFQSLRVGFNRAVALTLNTAPGASPLGTDPTLGALPGRNAPWITVPGLTGFQGGVGGQASTNYHFTNYQFFDDYGLTRGIHAMKFGFNLIRYQDDYMLDSSPNGRFTFATLSDFLTNAKATTFLSDVFLPLTLPGASGPVAPWLERGVRQTVWAGYFQDDIRLRKNLSVNLAYAMRWPASPRR